jgi:hypothetical protein
LAKGSYVPKLSCLFAIVMALAGCGGDSGQDAQSLVDQAAAKQAEAASLGVPTPCDQAQQCGLLTFQTPSGQCLAASYQAYSLVSPSADAASAAAAQEVSLATRAAQASPPTVCTQALVRPPTLSCVANTCVASH